MNAVVVGLINDPHRLIYLNTWYPVDGIVWGGYGALRSEVVMGESKVL